MDCLEAVNVHAAHARQQRVGAKRRVADHEFDGRHAGKRERVAERHPLDYAAEVEVSVGGFAHIVEPVAQPERGTRQFGTKRDDEPADRVHVLVMARRMASRSTS